MTIGRVLGTRWRSATKTQAGFSKQNASVEGEEAAKVGLMRQARHPGGGRNEEEGSRACQKCMAEAGQGSAGWLPGAVVGWESGGRQGATGHVARPPRGEAGDMSGEEGSQVPPVAAVASRTRRASVVRLSQTSAWKIVALPRGSPYTGKRLSFQCSKAALRPSTALRARW